MADSRSRYDGKHSEEHGLAPGELENDSRTHNADPPIAIGELSQRRDQEPLDPSTIERNRREKQDSNEIADQMEEFEGPDRREIRGGPHREPADDPGVAHS